MQENLRDSGIDIVGLIPWGTHFYQFYENQNDIAEILVPYFKAGLKNNEFCLWLTSDFFDSKEAKKALQTAVPDLENYIRKNQIEFAPCSEIYLQGGLFDRKKTIAIFKEKINKILKKGFSGLRAAGDTRLAVQKNFREFIEYEKEISKVFETSHVIGLCQFYLPECTVSNAIDLARTHDFLLMKREGKWSFDKNYSLIRTEKILREKEDFFRSVFENAQIGIYRTTPDGRILIANPSLAKMLGFSSVEELKSRNLEREGFERFSPRSQFKEKIDKNGNVAGVESVWIRGDGKLIHVKENARIVRGKDGRIEYYEGTVEDITEQKRMEESLKESEERYRSLVELAPDAIAVHSEGKIVFVNPAGLKLLGAEKSEQVIGKPVIEVVHPDSRKIAGDRIELMHSKKVAVPLIEEKFIKMDGSVVDVDVVATPFMYKGKNAVQVIVRDATERKRIENELKKREAEYKRISEEFNAILDVIPDILTLQDKDLKIVWANKTAYKYAVSPDVIGKHCFELWHNLNTPCKICPVIRCFSSKKPEQEQIIDKNGRIFDCRTIPIIEENGDVLRVVEAARDITDQNRLEAQYRHSQKMEAIGLFAGGISHDFNNILTAIIGYASLLQLKLGHDETSRSYAEQILSSSEKAVNLVQSILAFSRKHIINPKAVNLNDIVRNIDKLLQRVMGGDIGLNLSISDSEVIITADPVSIEQILMNLATNARDAMPDGGIFTITTGIAKLEEQFCRDNCFGKLGTYALLTVTDTGTGMEEAIRERIFEPFFTTKEFGKGTGLGLSIVYGIVQQHNGYISVFSKPNQGTVFKIFLPLLNKEITADDRKKDAALNQGTETILIAEDDSSVMKLSLEILKNAGYRVFTASNGLEAIRVYKKNSDNIHLLLFDIVMPGKSGLEAYKEIKKIKPDIKALFISGYTEHLQQKKVVSDEPLKIVAKPLTPVLLLKKIREVLDQ
jgi:PAS domain S-box-containing protein